jgi:hypothetical protein
MNEVHSRNGTLVISEDADDGDRIIVSDANSSAAISLTPTDANM